jgi:uncharacterized protein (DUF3820 family)
MKFPFGKYKGQDVEDVPSDYLMWLLENGDNVPVTLIDEMENQLKLREGQGVWRKGAR